MEIFVYRFLVMYSYTLIVRIICVILCRNQALLWLEVPQFPFWKDMECFCRCLPTEVGHLHGKSKCGRWNSCLADLRKAERRCGADHALRDPAARRCMCFTFTTTPLYGARLTEVRVVLPQQRPATRVTDGRRAAPLNRASRNRPARFSPLPARLLLLPHSLYLGIGLSVLYHSAHCLHGADPAIWKASARLEGAIDSKSSTQVWKCRKWSGVV